MSFNMKKIVAGVAVVATLAGVSTVATTQAASAARITSHTTGYIKDGSRFNGGYRWYDHGKLYTGFRFYMGTYYWFINGVRQNQGWRSAWGMTYYTDNTGRAVQGTYKVGSTVYDFGNNGTFFSRGVVKDAYVNVPGVGWRHAWGMTYYTDNQGRAVQGWRNIGGKNYYFGNNGTFFLRNTQPAQPSNPGNGGSSNIPDANGNISGDQGDNGSMLD